MKLTRRNFLAWAGLSAVGAVACEGFGIRQGELKIQSPVRLPEDLVEGIDNWYATLCRYCPSPHGVIVRVMAGRAKTIHGNPLYPATHGKQSPRCYLALQAAYHPARIPGPMRRTGPRGSGQYAAIDWNTGLDTLRQMLQERGNGLALVTENLSGMTGEVCARFANAFGGRHLAFEALDNNTYRQAIKNVFGQDTLPDFDIANANFLLSFSADFLSTWVSPVRWNWAYGEFRQGQGREVRGEFVHADPRFSMTASNADTWLPIRPGMEGKLALSLAYVIMEEGLAAPGVDVNALTNGQGAAALADFSPEVVGNQVLMVDHVHDMTSAQYLRQLARDFAGHRPSLAIGGGAAAAQTNGLFNLEAIYALNYLVGSVGAEGGIKLNPASPLANILGGASAVGSVGDWMDVAAGVRNGATRLVMIHNADPVHGLPAAVGFGESLNRDDVFIVSFSPLMDETTALADLILPGRAPLEDWGMDTPEPAPGYQVVGMQQPVINPLNSYNPRSFIDILLAAAQETGHDADLPWSTMQDMLREGAEQLFALNRGSVEGSTPEEFWNNMLRQGGWWDEREQGPGSVTPPSGLFNLIAAKSADPEFGGAAPGNDTFNLIPFAHNTLLDGRYADLPWAQSTPDPITTITWQTWVEMNDKRAAEMGLKQGDVVLLDSGPRGGSIRAILYPTPATPPDVVAAPLGQGRRHGSDYATGGIDGESSNVMNIIEANRNDAGALAWANTRVRVVPTGEFIKVSKFEGMGPARQVGFHEAEQIIKIIPLEPH